MSKKTPLRRPQQDIIVSTGHSMTAKPSTSRNSVPSNGTVRPRSRRVEAYRIRRRWQHGGETETRWYPLRVAVLVVHVLIVLIFCAMCCIHAACAGSRLSFSEFGYAVAYFFGAVFLGSLLAAWVEDIPVTYEVHRPRQQEQIEEVVIREVQDE